MFGMTDVKRTPCTNVITYAQAGERKPRGSRLSLLPLFEVLFVMRVPMIREIYAHFEVGV